MHFLDFLVVCSAWGSHGSKKSTRGQKAHDDAQVFVNLLLAFKTVTVGAPIMRYAGAQLSITPKASLMLSFGCGTCGARISAWKRAGNLAMQNLGDKLAGTQQPAGFMHDYTPIARGRAFVAPSWLSSELLRELRADMHKLREQGVLHLHGNLDRGFEGLERLSCELPSWCVHGEAEPSEARATAARLLETLRLELQSALDRELLPCQDPFYTIGVPGQPIPWHVDESHEEFQTRWSGVRIQKHHRSIAWLLYLSNEGWDKPGGSGSGGSLHLFTRHNGVGKCGAHEGNLQVGWLERGNGSEPVFLDSWVMPKWMRTEGYRSVADVRADWRNQQIDEEEIWSAMHGTQPAYMLYCIGAEGRRENLTQPHEAPAKDRSTGDWLDNVPSLREMLPEELRMGFSSTFCREHSQHQVVEVIPRGRTLVLFDPVVVPHEVLPVVMGERLLMGGWFYEKRRAPPSAWVDNEKQCDAWYRWRGWARADDNSEYDVL